QMVSDAGFDPVYGARPLRRAIQTKVEDPLSESILEGSVKPKNKYLCVLKDDKVSFEEQQQPSDESKDETE
ncbi:MAG: hypothetical protein ACI4W6_00735, partial [Acutalibacteraceae bacterium]